MASVLEGPAQRAYLGIAQIPPPLPVGKPRSFTPLSASLASLATTLHRLCVCLPHSRIDVISSMLQIIMSAHHQLVHVRVKHGHVGQTRSTTKCTPGHSFGALPISASLAYLATALHFLLPSSRHQMNRTREMYAVGCLSQNAQASKRTDPASLSTRPGSRRQLLVLLFPRHSLLCAHVWGLVISSISL